MKEKIKATHPHRHDHYHELIFLTEGAGFHTIDMNSLRVQPPQLFLVKARQVHYWEFTAIPKGFVIIFRTDFFMHLASSEIITGFKQLQTPSFVLQKQDNQLFAPVFEQMEKEYDRDQIYKTRIIASLLEVLLSRMIRLSRQVQEGQLSPGRQLLNRYQTLLHRHITEHHLVKDYAGLLHITPKHLNEVCTSTSSKTASEILTGTMLLEAKRRLLYTSGTIADTAYALGFDDASNFGSFFKRHANITPGRFRKEML